MNASITSAAYPILEINKTPNARALAHRIENRWFTRHSPGTHEWLFNVEGKTIKKVLIDQMVLIDTSPLSDDSVDSGSQSSGEANTEVASEME